MLNKIKTEIHGHRGCRGYYPENTIRGFLHAVGMNIDAIEMDVVISKDHQVVVSHEPFMHRKKCLWPTLQAITKEQELGLGLYQMHYHQIKDFDCGLLSHPNFPLLHTGAAHKPLLSEVIKAVELEIQLAEKKTITYNIEIKSEPDAVGKSQPDYITFVDLVLSEIINFKIENRVIIQSFDKEILKTLRRRNKDIKISLLIEDNTAPDIHINDLGFLPHILASDYNFLTADKVMQLHAKQIKVFAFTVNKLSDIQQMLAIGVDAIITDYPDIAVQCANSYK